MQKLWSALPALTLSLVLYLSSFRAFTPRIVRIAESGPDASTLLEAGLWLGIGALTAWQAKQAGFLAKVTRVLRQNLLLLVFVFFAVLSLTWSIAPAITFFRLIPFVCAAWFGILWGATRDERWLLDGLFWCGALFVILSLALVYALPGAGRMFDPPYDGAWRGLFWHKNHLGHVMALFNAIFLLRAVMNYPRSLFVLDAVFYLLSLILVYFSRSAAGLIILLGLNGLIILVGLWVRVQHRLKRVHYLALAGVFVLAAAGLFANIDRFLGVFNRSSDLTGRVQMWAYLFEQVVPDRPLLGHGFGVLWYLEAFRVQVQQAVGWTYQVLIGDNGLVDILLHLGYVGAVLFVLVFVQALWGALHMLWHRRTLESGFPLLVMAFVFLGNISFSLLFETEMLIWLLLCFVLARGLIIDWEPGQHSRQQAHGAAWQHGQPQKQGCPLGVEGQGVQFLAHYIRSQMPITERPARKPSSGSRRRESGTRRRSQNRICAWVGRLWRRNRRLASEVSSPTESR